MGDLDAHLAGIAARDEAAFAAWMAGAEPAIRRALASFAAVADVEAVIQETLLRIWQGAPGHRPDGRPDSLLRCALRIARNLAIDEARRTGRAVVLADDVPQDDDPPGGYFEPDPGLARIIRRCIDALTARPARALLARLRGGGGRDRELATGAGMAVNTYRQNIARARRALARCLAAHGVDLSEVWR